MALRPVGSGTSFATSTTSAKSIAISVQSDSLRLIAKTTGVYVAIGTEPTATTSDFYILGGTSETLALTPASQRVVGIITGATTTLVFPEGTGSPFEVGDYATLTCAEQTYYNFTHQPVISVNTTANVGGYYSTRVSIGTDSSGIVTAFNDRYTDLRKSIKVAALADSATGTLFLQQVQISGQS